MTTATENSPTETFESLQAFNAASFERHKHKRVFQMFGDGTLEDPTKRDVFLACLQHFSSTFQTILFMRQAHSADERYARLFRQHLREEVGHDDVLRKDRGCAEEVWDPYLEGIAAWLVSRMAMLDNVEKLAIVHLVMEASGAHMGAVSKEPAKAHGNPAYFGLHDELDTSHVTIAIEPIRSQPTETLARLRIVIDQAWQMMDAYVERVAALVLGNERPTFVTRETR